MSAPFSMIFRFVGRLSHVEKRPLAAWHSTSSRNSCPGSGVSR